MLASSLPRAIGRQREVLHLPAHGHTVVLGTAGSGKTTLAILRALYLADPSTDHGGRTLLVTYNRFLMTYLKRFTEAIKRPVVVEYYNSVARQYLRSRKRFRQNGICGFKEREQMIRSVLAQARAAAAEHPLLKHKDEFFYDEFEWIPQHGIQDVQTYLNAERLGRGTARVPKSQRAWLFELYRKYLALRENQGKQYDMNDLAGGVLRELRSDTTNRPYRHVVIDEGQDFSPEMLRSLAEFVPANGSLTFFGDVAQQIYGRRMSWRNAGLNTTKIWEFENNYRNTTQIADLALALAEKQHFSSDPDIVKPACHSDGGPLPLLRQFSSETGERQFIVRLLKEKSRTGTVAILFQKPQHENGFKPLLPETATKFHGDLRSWPSGPGLFYGTYHAAKGLEFDTVFLPYLSNRNWPNSFDVQRFGQEEATLRDGRLLYVGITRCRSDLVLTCTGQLTALLPGDERLYQR